MFKRCVIFTGKSLSICKADKSCCTSEMESNLMNLVKKDYQSLLQQNAQSVQGILASTAIHFTGNSFSHIVVLRYSRVKYDGFFFSSNRTYVCVYMYVKNVNDISSCLSFQLCTREYVYCCLPSRCEQIHWYLLFSGTARAS